MHYVLDASYEGGYRLKIRFGNDEIRIVDLSRHLAGHIFAPLRDLSYFRQFRVNQDIDTIVWPNNADFSPDFLYEISVPVHKPLRASRPAKRRAECRR